MIDYTENKGIYQINKEESKQEPFSNNINLGFSELSVKNLPEVDENFKKMFSEEKLGNYIVINKI